MAINIRTAMKKMSPTGKRFRSVVNAGIGRFAANESKVLKKRR